MRGLDFRGRIERVGLDGGDESREYVIVSGGKGMTNKWVRDLNCKGVDIDLE